MLSSILTLPLLAGAALASPLSRREMHAYTQDIEVHESCNSTQRRMLNDALADTFEMATFARDYAATNGPEDPIFTKYFGTDPKAFSAVIGIWEALLTSNKQGVLFRCDNIDGNCGQAGWRGHWRGDNATSETVICDLSYTDRLYNREFCMYGWTLTESAVADYWSIDLIHRLFHVPQVTNAVVQHFAEDYAEVLELAETNSSYAIYDQDALQYFAAHVYALEVAGGGDACIGEAHEHDHSDDGHAHSDASSSAAAPASTTSAPAASSAAADIPPPPAESTGCELHVDHYHCEGPASATASAESAEQTGDCHTHADGAVHCV